MKIGHGHLKVRNLNIALEFYTKVLGLRVSERVDDHFAFLTFGVADHDLALQELGEGASQPPPKAVGLYHLAFEVANRSELGAALLKLEEMGCATTLIDHRISWAIYTADPDGNGVEIYLDRRGSAGGEKIWNGISYSLNRQELVCSRSLRSANALSAT